MIATFRLLNSYFWKTIYGPILAFVFPVVLLAILGNLMRLEYVYPGLIALGMLFLGLIALPLAIMELKGSSLFKYIGSSPVNPMKFTLVAIGFYAIIAICTGFTICLATLAIFPHKVFPTSGFKYGVLGGIFSLKGSFSFYIGSAIHLVFVIMTGIVISTFARTPQQSLTIGLMVTLPSMFLSGMVLSVDVIGESSVMNWISRFIPFRYSTANLVVSATPIDQLNSGIDHWLNTPFNTDKGIHDLVNRSLNNIFDQLIWPYKDMKDPEVSKNILAYYPKLGNAQGVTDYLATLPNGGVGYKAWESSMFSIDIFNGVRMKNNDNTLFYLLYRNWDAMTLTSDNNIFQWTQDWGVRKIPSADVLLGFVKQYFKGYGPTANGHYDVGERVKNIANEVMAGKTDWLNVFIYQSNILYYRWDRVLNVCLPLVLSGLGSWYVFKNFSWSTR